MSSPSTSSKLSVGHFLAGAIALFLGVFAVYFPALDGEFVYDDLLVIQQNPQISSLANIPEIFASSYWDFLDAEGTSHVGYYRPLTMALVTVGFVLGDGTPEAFHLLSLVIYALACVAAWRFAARLMGSELGGFMAALLFAAHPLHVESVAWISALHDPLYALFGFLALSAFLRWRAGETGPWSVAVWFGLSLLSKDSAVAFVPVAFVLEACRKPEEGTPVARGLSSFAKALAPMLLAFAGYYLLRALVFGEVLAGFDRTTTDFGVGAGRLALLRVELIGGAMQLMMWPSELNLFRPFQPELPEGSSSLLIGILGSLGLGLAIGLAWMRRWRLPLTFLLLIPAALAPVIVRVESLGTFPLSDRFLFIPVIGFAALLVHLAWKALPQAASVALISLIAVALGVRSQAHLPHWQNEEALFRHAVELNPRNPNVHWGLGRVMLNKYAESGLSDHLLHARTSFESSMELLDAASKDGKDIYATHDDHLQTNLGLGHALLREAEVDPFHDYELVRTIFQKVIDYKPKSERGYIGLGVTWMAAGDPNQAATALRRAIQLNPNSPEAHFNMGVLMMRIEEWGESAKEFKRSLELRNNNRKDLIFLSRALVEDGQLTEARKYANQAHELFPGDADPMVLLGTIEAKGSQLGKGIQWFDKALQLTPNYGAAHLQRGLAYASLKDNAEAVNSLKTACELLPNSFEAHFNLMVLLLASDNPDLAMPYFFVAYRQRPANFTNRMIKAAESMHQDQVPNLVRLATIDADRNDLNTAVNWIQRAVELDPEDGPSNYIYGVLLTKLDNPDAALRHLRIAAETLTDSYQAQLEYSEVLLKKNQFAKAEPFLKRAYQLLPTQKMSKEMREKTEEIIRTALQNIEEAKRVGPPPPPENG